MIFSDLGTLRVRQTKSAQFIDWLQRSSFNSLATISIYLIYYLTRSISNNEICCVKKINLELLGVSTSRK